MRLRSLLAAGLMLAGTGCSSPEFLGNFARNFSEEPVRRTDECVLEKRCRKWADEAWDRLCTENADQEYSKYFRHGFKSGFVDFLIEGGKGIPPAVPPFFYQNFGAFTEPGQRNEAAREWFAGFRVGAAQARESGLRNDIIIPLSSPPFNAVDTRPTLAENDASRANAPTKPKLPDRADDALPKPMEPANGIEGLPKPAIRPDQP